MKPLSVYIQKIPILGRIYQNNYFAWKRSYLNFLRNSGIRPGPTVVHWLSTFRCNSKCVYCEASANEKVVTELTTDQIKSVIDEIRDLKTRHFFITGGEPLMRDDIFEVIQHAKLRGLSVGMITNSLLTKKYRNEIRRSELSSIWTSVDGSESTHDKNRGVNNSYRIALEAIRFYRDIKIPLRVVNTMVHPGNIDELPQLYNSLKEAGINRWRLALAIPVGRASENKWVLSKQEILNIFKFVEKERKNFDIELSEELGFLGCWDLKTKNTPFFCPSGLSFCVIMPDGNVLPCQVVYDNKYSEGNVLETSFAAIWEQGFKQFRKVELKGECKDCSFNLACSGGCWGRMLNEGECLRSVWNNEE